MSPPSLLNLREGVRLHKGNRPGLVGLGSAWGLEGREREQEQAGCFWCWGWSLRAYDHSSSLLLLSKGL